MSKNILLISSSPRKNANSDILCDEFLRGARDAGHSAEKIRLADKDINYCTGCCSCIGGGGKCAQQDDMAEIHAKILAADVLVRAAQPGTLAYYAPWGDVVLFYGSFGSASGLYELGRAVQGVEHIKALSGTIRVETSGDH